MEVSFFAEAYVLYGPTALAYGLIAGVFAAWRRWIRAWTVHVFCLLPFVLVWPLVTRGYLALQTGPVHSDVAFLGLWVSIGAATVWAYVVKSVVHAVGEGEQRKSPWWAHLAVFGGVFSLLIGLSTYLPRLARSSDVIVLTEEDMERIRAGGPLVDETQADEPDEPDDVMKLGEDIEALKVRALAGDEAAMRQAIKMLLNGDGAPKDEKEAYALAVKGAALGMHEAKAGLGLLLRMQDVEGIPHDPERAQSLLESAAKEGSEEAMFALMPSAILDQADYLLDFDKKFGLKDAEGAVLIAQSCLRKADENAASEQVASSMACSREWLDRADELDTDLSAKPAIALFRLQLAQKAEEKGMRGFGNVGELVEQGSKLEDPEGIAHVMMIQRAEWALDGLHVPKNAEIARQYAIKSTEINSRNIQSRAFILLWTLHAEGGEDSYFSDPARSYGWALLAKSVFSQEEWEQNGNERPLRAIESGLSSEDRLTVQKAVAEWKPGQDLALPVLSKGADAAPVTTSGTAFLISDDGFALTNAHVVKGCETLKASNGTAAATIAMDEANDLAAIRFGSYSERPYAKLEASSKLPRTGDRIAVFGFPLSEVLASTGNLTAGDVSANAGLGNNSSMFQISAPIQPGSSGSPVLSMRGNVAGVISSTASTVRLTQATGTIAQNLNFAINKDTLVGFLRSNGVPFEEAGDGIFSGGELDVAEIGERAREWTIRVECGR